ncbi:uncharacterized protein LOC130503231 [Raphanus sativus]|uniref:Uncharacterized protein LOC130503231 n=1 Tax=Raphanus sativus TaxID=3726 RepID=A0A9W3CQK8_RAPSA|nr:uncharacterized protein LOC130503231 [Raphanus sativus]
MLTYSFYFSFQMSTDSDTERERRTKRRSDPAGPSNRRIPRVPRDDERPPWPHVDKTPIAYREGRDFSDPRAVVSSRECTDRALTEQWDDFDSLHYNAWIDVDIEPTRFIDPEVTHKMRIQDDLYAMIAQLGLGTMATHAYDLHVPLVRQFMASVRLTYRPDGPKVAGDGVLSFFARGKRYSITIPQLCSIYGFEEDSSSCRFSPLPGVNDFWKIIGTGSWSGSATQSDVRHPTLRYFLRAIANTLLCKMEPNKVRLHDLSLLFPAVNGLVDLSHLDTAGLVVPNLGALFAEHLISLKKKPFTGSGRKKESVGSLLTPIFELCGVRLDRSTADRRHLFMDEQHLTHCVWLNESLLWFFRIDRRFRMFQLPHASLTDFDHQVDRIRFRPDDEFLLELTTESRQEPMERGVGGSQAAPAAPLPDFPDIPDVPMPEADFQRTVMSALRAIWARVTRPPCANRRSVRASDPGPSHQYQQEEDEEAAD